MKRALYLFIGVLLILLASGRGECEEDPTALFSDPETVHQELTTLLQDPQYAPQKTWEQWWEEQLGISSKRNFPRIGGISYQSGWLRGFYWFFLCICVLLLVMVVVYILWNLGLFALPFRKKSKKTPPADNPEESYLNRPYDDLAVLLQSLEQAHRFQDALTVMRLALLKYLHTRQILRFHPSKTNGEYRRECPESYRGLPDLRDYLTQYDRLLYAGQNWGEESYRRMKSLYLGMTSHEV